MQGDQFEEPENFRQFSETVRETLLERASQMAGPIIVYAVRPVTGKWVNL